MYGVTHKHRYFRIQVIVTVLISMAAYFAAREGLIDPGYHSSPAKDLGVQMFTLGPVLAACVLVYFQKGEIRFVSLIITTLLLYGVVLIWPFFIAGRELGPEYYAQERNYFAALNLVGFVIFGGIAAWLGKLLGILTLAAFGLGATSGNGDLIVFTPILAALDVTNIYAQWVIAIVVTISSFLADK